MFLYIWVLFQSKDSISTTSDWVIARDHNEARRLIAERCNCSINEVPVNLEQGNLGGMIGYRLNLLNLRPLFAIL